MSSVKIVDGKNNIEIEICDPGGDVDYLIQRVMAIVDHRLDTLRWGPQDKTLEVVVGNGF